MRNVLTTRSTAWAALVRRLHPRRQLAIFGWIGASANLAHATAPERQATPSSGTVPSIPTHLEVERDSGSEMCPDADGVFRAIAALYPERLFRRERSPNAARVSFLVRIRPTTDGHEATIQLGPPRTGERRIVDHGVDCRGLPDAIAVAVAMLVEPTSDTAAGSAAADRQKNDVAPSAATNQPNRSERRMTPPTASSATKASPRAPRSAASDSTNSSADERFTVHGFGGALGTLWVPNRPAAGAVLGVVLSHRSGWGVKLDGLASWAIPFEQGEGRITIGVLGGRAGLCWRGALYARTDYQACLDFGVGSMRAETRGFAVVYRATVRVPWVVVGPSVALIQRLSATTQGYFAFGALTNLRRDQFVVEGSHRAAIEAHAVGIISELGLRFGGPIH